MSIDTIGAQLIRQWQSRAFVSEFEFEAEGLALVPLPGRDVLLATASARLGLARRRG